VDVPVPEKISPEKMEKTATVEEEKTTGNEKFAAAAAIFEIGEGGKATGGDGDDPGDVPYNYNKRPGPNRPFVPLLDYLCCRHNCTIQELQILLFFIGSRRRIIEDLRRACDIKTVHLKEHNMIVPCDDLTCQAATTVFAFNGFMNITVPQYYYVKHKMILRHPYLPCVIVFGGGKHRSYFPLEVLAVAPKH
jgi:hypothetical protein